MRHHFTPCSSIAHTFDRLRSIQFDPIAPVGCNHDLVLQARLLNYKIGDWQRPAYQDRLIYDGWDKQASLVPFSSWQSRRIFHKWQREWFGRVFDDHPEAVKLILAEIEVKGPLMPRDCEFQARIEDWKPTWHGPSLTKQTLRALWHSGLIMTTGRKNGHHIYDLTERIVPSEIFNSPVLTDEEAIKEIVLDRHRGVGILRPTASTEIWTSELKAPLRSNAIRNLVEEEKLILIEIDGVKAHATPDFLQLLDHSQLDRKVTFVAPLDHFMWDRKMIAHLFDFDYIWEIYTPESKRKWGYYVLPVVYGDEFIGRIEFWCRKGVLEIRRWHQEPRELDSNFAAEFQEALQKFMAYCSASSLIIADGVDPKIKKLVESINKRSSRIKKSLAS